MTIADSGGGRTHSSRSLCPGKFRNMCEITGNVGYRINKSFQLLTLNLHCHFKILHQKSSSIEKMTFFCPEMTFFCILVASLIIYCEAMTFSRWGGTFILPRSLATCLAGEILIKKTATVFSSHPSRPHQVSHHLHLLLAQQQQQQQQC